MLGNMLYFLCHHSLLDIIQQTLGFSEAQAKRLWLQSAGLSPRDLSNDLRGFPLGFNHHVYTDFHGPPTLRPRPPFLTHRVVREPAINLTPVKPPLHF